MRHSGRKGVSSFVPASASCVLASSLALFLWALMWIESRGRLRVRHLGLLLQLLMKIYNDDSGELAGRHCLL